VRWGQNQWINGVCALIGGTGGIRNNADKNGGNVGIVLRLYDRVAGMNADV